MWCEWVKHLSNDNLHSPVAARDIDACQYDLVWYVVYVEKCPAQSLFLASQVDLVEDYDVDEIHGDGRAEENTAEYRANVE